MVFELDDRCFTLYSDEGKALHTPGTYQVFVGGSLPTERSLALGASPAVSAEVVVSEV